MRAKKKISTKSFKAVTNLALKWGEVDKTFPLRYNHSGNFPEVGLDEAGMACLAGPVYVAAVILPLGFSHKLIRDSKLLLPEQRDEAREIILQNAIDYSVASANVELIDEVNIYHARFRAMHVALSQLKIKPKHIVVDGNRFPAYKKIPHSCIVKGDTKYLSIAAASILAKTSRDAFMKNLHNDFPQYNWQSNKGYPTPSHRKAILEFGTCIHHRTTFTQLRESDIINATVLTAD